MFTLIVIALFGYSTVTSNTGSLTDWTKVVLTSATEAANPTLPWTRTDGSYLADGPTEIIWAPCEERPAAFAVMAPVVIEAPKEKPHKMPKKSADSATVSTTKQLGGTDDLGLLDSKTSNLGVNTDEILSYFEKTPISKAKGNDDNRPQPTDTPAP